MLDCYENSVLALRQIKNSPGKCWNTYRGLTTT